MKEMLNFILDILAVADLFCFLFIVTFLSLSLSLPLSLFWIAQRDGWSVLNL